MARDGRSFLTTEPVTRGSGESEPGWVVVQNFFEKLKEGGG
jgi:hypothetical protein